MSGTATRQRGLWWHLLGTSRPISWINTAYPFAAAHLVFTGEVDVTWVVGTIYFLIPYNLLMYGVNDVFDHESDLRNPRKGGVEGVVLDPRWHRWVLIIAGVVNLPFLVWLVAVGTTASSVVLAVSVFAVLAYSLPALRFKERPMIDSITSSTHFVSPAVFALVLAGAQWDRALVAVVAAFFLWGMASQAFGAVQDISADRGAGIASVATWLGARHTVRAAMVTYAAAALLVLFAGWPAALAAVVPLLYVISIGGFRNLPDESCGRARAGWRRFLWLNVVSGFLITQLLIGTGVGFF